MNRLISFLVTAALAATMDAQTTRPLPSASQLAWQNDEIGVVFHYDLHVFDGRRYSQEVNRITPIDDYNIFCPRHLDTDQWVRCAKAAGAKFALLTVTHETGFALYQSDVNPYCLKALRWRDGRGDLVADFVASCRRYGLQPGVYVGIRWNAFLGIHDFRAEGDGTFAANRQKWYKHLCEQMVTELCTRYGPLFMIWFDGGADDPAGDGPDVLPIVKKWQPQCLFYHNVQLADVRWGGSEGGMVDSTCWSTFPRPYSHHSGFTENPDHLALLRHGDPDGSYWMPAMADLPLRSGAGRHEWFWEPGDDNAVLPLGALMDRYEKSVGRNATLMLGLTPDTAGLLPKGDSLRLQEFGRLVEARYGHPLAETAGHGSKYVLRLTGRETVQAAVVQEDLTKGERVRGYVVEAGVDGRWRRVAEGQCIGHKHIVRFAPVTADRLRLTVTKWVAEPQIKNFSVFK
jgi:alpha-L-fucosidase